MEEAYYRGKPIASVESLSAALSIPSEILINTSNNADRYYKQNTPEKKPNGKIRITYRVDSSLKEIQDRVKIRIFQKVYYPEYLQGSIKDTEKPRDYVSDARIHSGNRMVVSEDVSEFFPSIKCDQVLILWKYFFNFPDQIARLLTSLTTYNGFLPQGSKTSSYIANLIFWKYEPALVSELKKQGVTYSRYVDDITVSFNRFISNKELGEIISRIFGMMLKVGIAPNRDKQVIGNRKNNISVHNLNVNTCSPTIKRSRRNNVRMAVFNCIKYSKRCGRSGEKYKKMYQSSMTRVGQLARLHPSQGKRLREKLLPYKPIKS